jgi:hypothetical protein
MISCFLFVTTHQQVDRKHRGSSAASRSRSRPSGRHAPSYTAESSACLHMQASSTSKVAVVDGGIEQLSTCTGEIAHRGAKEAGYPPRRQLPKRERGGRAALHDTFSSSGCIRSPGAALHAKRGSDSERKQIEVYWKLFAWVRSHIQRPKLRKYFLSKIQILYLSYLLMYSLPYQI